MGIRKISIRHSVADNISSIAWFIESKGMVKTAEKFVDAIYDFLEKLADDRKSYALCRNEVRRVLGYKCITYRKKYTIVFIETDTEIIVSEFLLTKLIT